MRISTVLVASAALALFQAAAQVAVQGTFPPHLAGSFALSSNGQDAARLPVSIQRLTPPSLALPRLSNAELIQLEEEETQAKLRLSASSSERNAYKGAYQFGKAVEVQSFAPDSFRSTLEAGRWMPISRYLRGASALENKGYTVYSTKTKRQHGEFLARKKRMLDRMPLQVAMQQEQADETMVWQLEVASEGALSLNLIFSAFELPEGAEFYVSGRHHALGAFTGSVNNKADGKFATAPIKGDRLLLQMFMPKQLYDRGIMPKLELSHVIHGYRPMMTGATKSALDSPASPLKEGEGLRDEHRREQRRRPAMLDQSARPSLFSATQEPSLDDNNDGLHVMSGKCNLDVACFGDYQDQKRSVGVILTDYNQKYCTGSLINNARNDGRQLFLTAYHCTGFSDTSEHLVMFNYEKTQCGGTGEEINEHDTAQGLVKLGAYMDSDYTLYEIVEPIPDGYNLYLSGWSASPHAPTTRDKRSSSVPPTLEDEKNDLQFKKRSLYDDFRSEVNEYLNSPTDDDEEELMIIKKKHRGGGGRRRPSEPEPNPTPNPTETEPIFGIHHPGGDIMKVSFVLNGTLPKACWTDCAADQYYHWQIPKWDRGTTEPGSSGSPLFNADKRIVGQLHGGTASCYNTNGYDVYGGLHASFRVPPRIKDRLATYLDPDQTGIQAMDGMSLDIARKDFRLRMMAQGPGQQGMNMKKQHQDGVEGDRDEYGNFVIRESLAGPMGDHGHIKPLGDQLRALPPLSEERKWWDRFFG